MPNPTRTLFPRDALPHKINRRGALKSPTQPALAHKISSRGALKTPKVIFCCSVQFSQFGRRVQLQRVRVGIFKNAEKNVEGSTGKKKVPGYLKKTIAERKKKRGRLPGAPAPFFAM